MNIEGVLSVMESIAPLRLAADWDNVGLILDPPGSREPRRIFLTIDLTNAVLNEALAASADLIIAYHPPMFQGINRLCVSDPSQRVLLRAIAAGIRVYSPHTALDAARGGMNDWLLEGFGAVDYAKPLVPDAEDPSVGAGRRARLRAPRPVASIVGEIKGHLGLSYLRLAAIGNPAVRTVAVCPGAGGSLFKGVTDVDLLLTGEMRHHDVLAHNAAGRAVILTEHTHTERGYLPRLAHTLQSTLGKPCEVLISAADADPLEIV